VSTSERVHPETRTYLTARGGSRITSRDVRLSSTVSLAAGDTMGTDVVLLTVTPWDLRLRCPGSTAGRASVIACPHCRRST